MDFILALVPYLGTLLSWEVLRYLFTLKSQKKKAKAEADSVTLLNKEKEFNIGKDQCSYLKSICDQTIKDFYESEANFRKQIRQYREDLDKLDQEWAEKYKEKCLEIVSVRDELTRIKCLICYKTSCTERDLTEPCTQKN